MNQPAFNQRAVLSLFAFALVIAEAVAVCGAGVWSRQDARTMAWLHAVYFVDQQRGWAVGGNGALLSTTDGGQNWTAGRRPTDDALRDVYFADEQNGWLVCERSIYLLKTKDEPRTYLMKTSDGGQTWRRVNVIGTETDARLVRAVFTREGRAWAFGEGGVLYTTRDGGASWQRQRAPTRYLLLGGSFVDGETGWLVGAGTTILQTTDGGQTWRANLVDASGVRFTAASFVDRWHGWAVGAEGSVFVTTNGGRSWRAQNSNVQADLFDVKFLDLMEGWAVGDEGTVIHTVDGGARWSQVPSQTTHRLERLSFVDRAHGWAVGFGGTILAYDQSATDRAPQLKSQK